MGGGRRNFIPNTEADPEYPTKTGYRKDGRNLINEYLAKYPETHYTWNKTTFDAIDPNKAEKILGRSMQPFTLLTALTSANNRLCRNRDRVVLLERAPTF